MVSQKWWVAGLTGLVIIALLPVAGHWLRGPHEPRCAWDGLELAPRYQVRITETADQSTRFCCLRCAEAWLEHHEDTPSRILVTDETTGAALEANLAHYVRSTVIINPVTRERRHAFARLEDATRHAAAAHGRRLLGAERPFAKMEATDFGP